jgi:hypothetical protein
MAQKELFMNPSTPNNANDKAWRILDYEVQMFLGIGHLRSNLKIEGGLEGQLIRNALVESSLLHIRILIDIFLSRGKQPDDINLEQLGYDSKSIEPILSQKVNALKIVYGESSDKTSNCWTINKRLAHPTTHRTEGYDYSNLFMSLDKPLKEIIRYIYENQARPLPFPLKS